MLNISFKENSIKSKIKYLSRNWGPLLILLESSKGVEFNGADFGNF
jgi:hypothetical protein